MKDKKYTVVGFNAKGICIDETPNRTPKQAGFLIASIMDEISRGTSPIVAAIVRSPNENDKIVARCGCEDVLKQIK